MLCFLACVASYAVNRSTIEPDYNWKFIFPKRAAYTYVESATEIPYDLNQFTVSYWVENLEGSDYDYQGHFSTPNKELEFYTQGSDLTLVVNDGKKYGNGWFGVRWQRAHIVISWLNEGVDGYAKAVIWINGVLVSDYRLNKLATGSVIKKGLRLKLGTIPRDGPHKYPKFFQGDIMYFNLYDRYVNTAEEVAKLARATVDPEAIVPWNSFKGGAHGSVGMKPEFELYTKSFTSISCLDDSMTLTIDRAGFPHLLPSRGSLKDPACKVTWNNNTVFVTTKLGECGSMVSLNASSDVTYTNYFVPDILNPPTFSTETVGSGGLAMNDTRIIPFSCKYDITPYRSMALYAVASSSYGLKDKAAHGIALDLKLYHDSSFKAMYEDSEYPLHADNQERIYAEARLSNGGKNIIPRWVLVVIAHITHAMKPWLARLPIQEKILQLIKCTRLSPQKFNQPEPPAEP